MPETFPAIRFAAGGTPRALAAGVFCANKPQASLLVSHCHLRNYAKHRHELSARAWVLDSGAFTYHNTGTSIELARIIADYKAIAAWSDPPTEMFSLDVIGDHVASLHNFEAMTDAGLDVIPTFHYGSPWSALDAIKHCDKIALGGIAKMSKHSGDRDRWIGQCFARVWPKRIHCFGITDVRSLLTFPYHTVDSTSWQTRQARFGQWSRFGQSGILKFPDPVAGARAQVDFFLEVEERMRYHWQREMQDLA
jgi:hypothetical protein